MFRKLSKFNLIERLIQTKLCIQRSASTGHQIDANSGDENCLYLDSTDVNTLEAIKNSMKIINDFVSEDEEKSLLKEIEPYMKRLRYESSHWDDAIHNYRETERLVWTPENQVIIDRVRRTAFPPEVRPIKTVHILDLAKDGVIKAHVDAVRFCGDTIAGISLLTSSVMRLVKQNDTKFFVDVLLKRRSLYIMTGSARYDYTHEILANDVSVFRGQMVEKGRRISVICRNEPEHSGDDNGADNYSNSSRVR